MYLQGLQIIVFVLNSIVLNYKKFNQILHYYVIYILLCYIESFYQHNIRSLLERFDTKPLNLTQLKIQRDSNFETNSNLLKTKRLWNDCIDVQLINLLLYFEFYFVVGTYLVMNIKFSLQRGEPRNVRMDSFGLSFNDLLSNQISSRQ